MITKHSYRIFQIPVKILLTIVFIFSSFDVSYADCRGCCSRHGGVCCISGTTMCCDGTSLSDTCKSKGCSVCSINNGNDSSNSSYNYKIRLYGIDCPESSQNYGYEAEQFTRSLALNKTVTVEKIDTDMYGRIVALVYLPDGKLLNEELVKNGYAWVYDQYCTISICNNWKILEQEAQNNHKGLWQDPSPIPPWEYRQIYTSSIQILASSEKFTGAVTSVIDGDTIIVTKTSTSSNTSGTEGAGGCSFGNNNTSLFLILSVLALILIRKHRLVKN